MKYTKKHVWITDECFAGFERDTAYDVRDAMFLADETDLEAKTLVLRESVRREAV